ncbi:DUF4287 domain-containing protein [Deinococcus sp. YIM 134068]|uniref:DUF4287 domain-containing protein n=1 Tax=Deinococcus lichenicola TaxID=3118910 RepID=UPI002F93C8A4
MSETPDKVKQSYYRNIEQKTGVPIDEWMGRIRERDFTRFMEIVNWLKAEHGFGHGHASLLAHDALKLREGARQEN